MVAARLKLCRNGDLIAIATKTRVVTGFRSTSACQPARRAASANRDQRPQVVATRRPLYGMGGAVIGINPATDNVEATIRLLRVSTTCGSSSDQPSPASSPMLTYDRGVRGDAPVDLVAVAGTQTANASFGVSLALLKGRGRRRRRWKLRGSVGKRDNTRDQPGRIGGRPPRHLISRRWRRSGPMRCISPLLVNTVVSFIEGLNISTTPGSHPGGPRGSFCAKLLGGVPMGVDVCYTNHAGRPIRTAWTTSRCCSPMPASTFLIAVPGADDIMLNYQSLSHHDVLRLRHLLRLRPAPDSSLARPIRAFGRSRPGAAARRRRRQRRRLLTAGGAAWAA